MWCLQAAGSEQRESGELEPTPEAVEAWVGQLGQRFASDPIAVAIEPSRGAVVFMLSKDEPLHLFPVPSQMSASMRQALDPSGAKDDPGDADLLRCWICGCNMATSCAACRRTAKPHGFELDTEWVRGLLEGWPSLEELQKVPPSRLRAFLRKHHG